MTTHIYVRSGARLRLGELDDYKSLTVTTRHTGAGSWQLETDMSASLASLFGPGTGIVIERDGKVIMSGPVSNVTRSKSADADKLTISGHEDSVWLARRWVQPCKPNYTAAPFIYNAATHDVWSGTGESAIKHYVAFALSGAATAERQLRGLVIATNQERGRQVKVQARFDRLDELLTSIALMSGDLGYSLRQNAADSPLMIFDVTEPRDLSGDIRFSTELGNLASFQYSQEAPQVNAVLIAAGGEGTQRMILEVADTASINSGWGRIEAFRDRRDTTEIVQMQHTADEELAKGAQRLSLQVDVADTEYMKYGRDWGVSDRVSVEIDGVRFDEIVREATVTWAPDAPERVSVVIGSPEATAPHVLNIFAAQRQIAARTAQLERRR